MKNRELNIDQVINRSNIIGTLFFFGVIMIVSFLGALGVFLFVEDSNPSLITVGAVFSVIGVVLILVALLFSYVNYHSSNLYVFRTIYYSPYFEPWHRFDTRVILRKNNKPLFGWIDCYQHCYIAESEQDAVKISLKRNFKILGPVRCLYQKILK